MKTNKKLLTLRRSKGPVDKNVELSLVNYLRVNICLYIDNESEDWDVTVALAVVNGDRKLVNESIIMIYDSDSVHHLPHPKPKAAEESICVDSRFSLKYLCLTSRETLLNAPFNGLDPFLSTDPYMAPTVDIKDTGIWYLEECISNHEVLPHYSVSLCMVGTCRTASMWGLDDILFVILGIPRLTFIWSALGRYKRIWQCRLVNPFWKS